MAQPRVTVYTTTACAYCVRAKHLLHKRNVPFREIDLSRSVEGRMQLIERTGMMTFPQILIDDEPIGGFRELALADRAGRLEPLASAA